MKCMDAGVPAPGSGSPPDTGCGCSVPWVGIPRTTRHLTGLPGAGGHPEPHPAVVGGRQPRKMPDGSPSDSECEHVLDAFASPRFDGRYPGRPLRCCRVKDDAFDRSAPCIASRPRSSRWVNGAIGTRPSVHRARDSRRIGPGRGTSHARLVRGPGCHSTSMFCPASSVEIRLGQGIKPRVLALHPDRGAPMTSRPDARATRRIVPRSAMAPPSPKPGSRPCGYHPG